MPTMSFEILFVSFAALVVLVLILIALAFYFQSARNRLPFATRYENLVQKINELQERRAELAAEIEKLEEESEQRNALAVTIAALQARHDELVIETEDLKKKEPELIDFRRQIQDLIEEHAEIVQKIEEKSRALGELEGRTESYERRMLRADELNTILEERRQLLSKDIAELEEQQTSVERLRSEATRLRDEVGRLTSEQVEASARIAEAKAHLARLEMDLAQAQDALAGKQEAQDELERVRSEHRDVKRAVSESEEKAGALRASIAAMEEKIRQGAGSSANPIEDLLQPPACLPRPNVGPPPAFALQSESAALERVASHLAACGLRFDSRDVKAFHTALKVNEISPMTVLAGISGTGKSQLPRRYAEAMGINFLQVAVQPRWDSPQDLLGFYNYIERRYQATELAQALIHLDPVNWQAQAEPYAGQMLLVLLDEMNLARVEYYFSEFLSRLEMRPSIAESRIPERRRLSEIAIEVPGASHAVYPGHHLLFAGTMNEDESTQALSDKVLDRANVMQFARPKDLAIPTPPATAGDPTERLLHFDSWTQWVRTPAELPGDRAERARAIVAELSEIMAEVGRPFGYRLSQAMVAYVANHPDTLQDGAELPLADQVRMRLLPRLRGLEEEAAGRLNSLQNLVADELGDEPLAGSIGKAVAEAGSSGVFAWHGVQD